jgi:hypothetical protein
MPSACAHFGIMPYCLIGRRKVTWLSCCVNKIFSLEEVIVVVCWLLSYIVFKCSDRKGCQCCGSFVLGWRKDSLWTVLEFVVFPCSLIRQNFVSFQEFDLKDLNEFTYCTFSPNHYYLSQNNFLFQFLWIWYSVLCWSKEHFWLGFQRLIKYERTSSYSGESSYDSEIKIRCYFTAAI